MISGMFRANKYSTIGRSSFVGPFFHTRDTVNKECKKTIPEYPLKSAFVPSNSCNNSNGLQEQHVRLNPYV